MARAIERWQFQNVEHLLCDVVLPPEPTGTDVLKYVAFFNAVVGPYAAHVTAYNRERWIELVYWGAGSGLAAVLLELAWPGTGGVALLSSSCVLGLLLMYGQGPLAFARPRFADSAIGLTPVRREHMQWLRQHVSAAGLAKIEALGDEGPVTYATLLGFMNDAIDGMVVEYNRTFGGK